MKFSIVLLLTLLLVGCAGSSATTSVSSSYTTPTGSNITVTKESSVESDSDTANPPEVSLDSILLTPVVLGENKTIDNEGNATSTPEIGINIDTGRSSGSGSFLSQAEAILPLLKWPMIIGAILMAGGLILWIANPFVLPVFRKIGMAAAVAGVILMYLSVQFASIIWLLNIIGVVMLLGLVGFVLWFIFKKKSDALKQTVVGMEVMKKHLTPIKKEELFDKLAASVPLLQTPDTKLLINKIRAKEGFTEVTTKTATVVADKSVSTSVDKES